MKNSKMKEEFQALCDKYRPLFYEAIELDIKALAGRTPKDSEDGEYEKVESEYRKERDVIRRKYGLET